MERVFRKKVWSLVLAIALLLGVLVPTVSAENNDADIINYTALGDSLAAGMTPEKTISTGYADMTANYFKQGDVLGTYTKEFAVPGYTTENVLADLTAKPEVQKAVKNSHLITISAGANDLLKEGKVDPKTNTFIIDQTIIPAKFQTIAENYAKILQKIHHLNPDAAVFVMGYYFPFPYLADEQKPQLIQLTHTLNKTIQTVAIAQGAYFVPVYDKFGDNPKQYIPNPADVHPNQEGYQLMADALIESIEKAFPTALDVPEGFWAEKELDILLANGIYKLDEKGNVYPNKAITRAEVASILFTVVPMPANIPVNPGFKDVPETHPAYMAIAKLTEAGVFAKADYFHPDAPLTRVQMAKVLSLALQLKGDGKIPNYKDINAKYWAAPYIDAVTDARLMVGYKNGKFGLHDPITKAQFAVVFVRATKTK